MDTLWGSESKRARSHGHKELKTCLDIILSDSQVRYFKILNLSHNGWVFTEPYA
jgi:hypothetical protein